MKLRRFVGVVLVAAVVSLGAAACDVRVAGKRCNVPGATAQDSTHLLVCTNGKWVRSLTKVQIAFLLLAVIQSQTPQDVTAGNGHSCAGMENGDVRCWGFNSSGQLGDGSTTNSTKSVLAKGVSVNGTSRTSGGATPTAMRGEFDVGAEFGCAIHPEKFAASTLSQLRCWGFNGFGQLGDSSTTNQSTAVETVAPGVEHVATGTVHTCASVQFKGIECWGQNAAGQLGNNSTTSASSPVVVTGMSDKNGSVAAGGSHSCALIGSAVSCWGGNGSGQLGDGTTTQRLTPVAVALANVAQISAGGEETCAVLGDGTARCWGGNSSGQIGDGSTTNRTAPTAVSGLTTVRSISVGQDHACAIVGDGAVSCWGSNANGQLGDGTTTSSSSPVTVPGITRATSVSAGFGHTCAVADKQVTCWGRNDFGQLGDGTTVERHGPVKVSF